MTPKHPKTAVVAFKVEQELADLLDKLPNKSSFIRKAIAAQTRGGLSAVQRRRRGFARRPRSLHIAPLSVQFAAVRQLRA